MRPRLPLAAATAVLALAASAPASTAAPAPHAGTTSGAPAASGTGPAAPTTRHGHACSPRVAIQGYSDDLDKTVHNGLDVAGISALAPDTDGQIAALSDRSALFTLDVRGHGARTTGSAALADEKGEALDSEGLVVERDGKRLVTSETEPSVRRHTRDGAFTGERLPVPAALRVAPQGRAQENQTFEGLTAHRGGRELIASMEGQLSGDGSDEKGRPLVRFQTWQRAHGTYEVSRQWGYPVDKKLGVAEVTATGDGRLLVLERGYDVETGANTIRLYLADPRGADDVRHVDTLAQRQGDGARMVRKTLLADLGDCPDLGAPNPSPQPNPLLDNIEALAVTGHAPGGRLRLLLASDDNLSAEQVTRLYALTVRLPRA